MGDSSQPDLARAVSPARPLSDPEFACVQAFCARIIDDILDLALITHVESDFHAFARHRRSVGDGFCDPSFDPTRCTIGAGDFWLRVVDDAGDTVAAGATRILHGVDDFFQLMLSERLWGERPLRPVGRCRPVCSIAPFGGVIAHFGGLWVEPSQRGRGLAKLVAALARGLALRNHAFDFETSLVFEPLVDVAKRQREYPRCDLVIDGHFPSTGRSERVYLCHRSRAEALRAMGCAVPDGGKPLSAVA
jgi:hypothetical protein